MGSTLCNVFAVMALLILFANGVHAVFMFIATIDDMSNDCIFKLLYTVVSILYAALTLMIEVESGSLLAILIPSVAIGFVMITDIFIKYKREDKAE